MLQQQLRYGQCHHKYNEHDDQRFFHPLSKQQKQVFVSARRFVMILRLHEHATLLFWMVVYPMTGKICPLIFTDFELPFEAEADNLLPVAVADFGVTQDDLLLSRFHGLYAHDFAFERHMLDLPVLIVNQQHAACCLPGMSGNVTVAIKGNAAAADILRQRNELQLLR